MRVGAVKLHDRHWFYSVVHCLFSQRSGWINYLIVSEERLKSRRPKIPGLKQGIFFKIYSNRDFGFRRKPRIFFSICLLLKWDVANRINQFAKQTLRHAPQIYSKSSSDKKRIFLSMKAILTNREKFRIRKQTVTRRQLTFDREARRLALRKKTKRFCRKTKSNWF